MSSTMACSAAGYPTAGMFQRTGALGWEVGEGVRVAERGSMGEALMDAQFCMLERSSSPDSMFNGDIMLGCSSG